MSGNLYINLRMTYLAEEGVSYEEYKEDHDKIVASTGGNSADIKTMFVEPLISLSELENILRKRFSSDLSSSCLDDDDDREHVIKEILEVAAQVQDC